MTLETVQRSDTTLMMVGHLDVVSGLLTKSQPSKSTAARDIRCLLKSVVLDWKCANGAMAAKKSGTGIFYDACGGCAS